MRSSGGAGHALRQLLRLLLLLGLLLGGAAAQNASLTTAEPTPSSGTANPTQGATNAPTLAPVTPPTPAPVPATASPTVPANTTEPTAAPVTPAPSMSPTATRTPIEATIRGLSVTFSGVDAQLVGANALLDWEDVTKVWFQNAYNGYYSSSSGRALRGDHPPGAHRRLYSDPSKIGISQMRTELKVEDAFDAGGGDYTILYDQVMKFVSDYSYSAESLAKLPFQYETTNAAYRTELQTNVAGFSGVTGVSVPQVLTQAPTSSPSNQDTFWTLPVIIGIAVGGAVLLCFVAWAAYSLGRPKSARSQAAPATNSLSQTYGSSGPYGKQPAAQISALGSYDDVSAMEEPTIPIVITSASGDVYGDQSVATVDYDYSKAYGGAGDTSVVSSVGGTLGDNTRFTNGEPLTSSRVAALGASFESDDADRRRSNLKEEIIEVMAPAGKLGVVIDTPDEGAPVVHAVKDSSVIADQIQVGDKLIAVDDEDVRSMTAIKVSKLISKKSANPTRKLTIMRTSFVDDGDD